MGTVTMQVAEETAENDFQRLVEALPGPVLVYDGERILYANEAVLAALKYPREELVGQPLLDFVVTDDATRTASRAQEIFDRAAPVYGRDVRFRRSDGATLVFELASIPIVFEGRPARLVAGYDLTERRAAEERFQTLFDASPLAIGTVDVTMSTAVWNAAAARIFRWSGPRRGFPSEMTPENRAILTDLCLRAKAEGSVEEERLFHRWDGEDQYLRLAFAPTRDMTGRITGFVGVAADLTAMWRAEREVQAAADEWQRTFDAVEDPILVVSGPDFLIRRLNLAARRLCPNDPCGGPLAGLGDEEPWRTARRVVARGREEGTGGQEQVRAADRTWLVTATSLTGDAGDRQILVLTDVTVVLGLQDSLRRSEAVAAMGSLVAGVAHEARNPLFGMSATLDAFEARFGGLEAQAPFITALRRELGHLNDLMHDLLEYGKPPPSAPAHEPLAPIVAQAVRATRPLAERLGVKVENAVDGVGELTTDPTRLVQVFQNLLENAVQHSPRGAVVRIEGALLQGWVEIRVLDAGPGFRTEDLPNVFKPFYTRRRGGTGLGLSIVQRIVEQHQGLVSAGNREDGGAVVTVRLPLG